MAGFAVLLAVVGSIGLAASKFCRPCSSGAQGLRSALQARASPRHTRTPPDFRCLNAIICLAFLCLWPSRYCEYLSHALIGASFHKSMSTAEPQSAMPSRAPASTGHDHGLEAERRVDKCARLLAGTAARLYAAGPVIVLGGVRGHARQPVHRGRARPHVGGFLGCAIAIASTLLCYFFEFQNDTSAVSTILGVVIVFPITALIGFAFSRREKALEAFSRLLGNAEALLGAVCTWQKFQDGEWRRVTDDGSARERVLTACCRIAEKASRDCATPRGHRTRYVLSSYHSESETLNHLLYLRKSEVGSAIQACRRLVQQLKVDGLPGGEAHRLDQYLSIIACHFHQVAMLKEPDARRGPGACAHLGGLARDICRPMVRKPLGAGRHRTGVP